jgi:hypothetical protein
MISCGCSENEPNCCEGFKVFDGVDSMEHIAVVARRRPRAAAAGAARRGGARLRGLSAQR